MADWQLIDTCPEKTVVLLYQPKKDGEQLPNGGLLYCSEGMLVGSIEWNYHKGADGQRDLRRERWISVYPELVGGWEMECEMDYPSHWMPLPNKP